MGRWKRLPPVAGMAVLAACTTNCATNPATGERQISLIGEDQEIQMGRAANQDVAASLGFYGDDQLEAYVSRIGQRMAAASERPELPWTFHVVDDPSVNAFAIPGGFIYVTRGLLATIGSEAELAAVLGHEIGHVTARHAIERLSKAQLFNLGLGVGMILEPGLQQFGDLAGVGLNLLFLKYSRDDERQSDDLGIRYMTATGYDPSAMAHVFALLARASQTEGQGRVPGWLATHPDPESRQERAEEAVAGLPADARQGMVDRTEFLDTIDGIVYGPDPRQGFFEDGTFYHPELRFRIDFPSGWQTMNQRRAVVGASPQGDAIVVLTLVDEPDIEAAARAFSSGRNVRTTSFSRRSVDGLPAAAAEFEALAEQNLVVRGAVVFVDYGGRVYRLMGYAPRQRWSRYDTVVSRWAGSFGRVTDRRVLDVEPKRIEIVEVPEATTFSGFTRAFPSTVSEDVIALINEAADPGQRIPEGALVKRVVGGR